VTEASLLNGFVVFGNWWMPTASLAVILKEILDTIALTDSGGGLHLRGTITYNPDTRRADE